MAPCVYRSRYWHWVPRGQRSGGWTPNSSTLRTSYWLSTVLDINVDIIYYGRYQGRYQGLHSRMAGGQGRSAPEDEEAWHSSHTLGTHLTPWHTMNTALGFIIYYLLCLLSKHINIYYLFIIFYILNLPATYYSPNTISRLVWLNWISFFLCTSKLWVQSTPAFYEILMIILFYQGTKLHTHMYLSIILATKYVRDLTTEIFLALE